MSAIDVTQLTMSQAAAAFRGGLFSPLELTETYLQRIEQLDSTLNSFITVTANAALKAASQATDELAHGKDRGPLHGIPIAYKDLIATAGLRTTGASRIFADRIPQEDATTVQQLSAAGAVSLGKLNMLECAYGVVHPDFGPALNPWSLGHSSGGSSSGSAVAVAAGLCLGALGTDTGGSIRIPAAWCGIVGHKPTYGLISRHGVDPLSWSLDHVGPMTRTVDDAALLLEAIAGYDPLDPGSAQASPFRAADLDRVDVSSIRVGVPRDLMEQSVDREIGAITEAALDQLRRVVASVEFVNLPSSDDLLSTEFVILFAEAASFHQPWLRTRPEDYAPLTRDRLEAGSVIPAIHYIDAQRKRRELVQQFAQLHRHVDVVALPSSPTPAMQLTDTSLSINGQSTDVFHGLIRLTGPFNVTGAPAVSIPCGMTASGLPVGLWIMQSDTRVRTRAAWEFLVFTLNGLAFILIGLQLSTILSGQVERSLGELVPITAIIAVTVIVVRLAWVFGAAALKFAWQRLQSSASAPPSWRETFITGWSGLRGVVALASVLALPLSTPVRWQRKLRWRG